MSGTMASVWWSFVILFIQNAVQNKAETRFCASSRDCICTNNDLCTLQCNGKDQCKGSDVTLGCRAGYPCNVICNSAGEENACQDALIDGSTATDLTVACHDKQSCLAARIKCGTGSCNVICISTDSTGSNCEGLTIYCGAGACRIQCDIGPNMCSNVKVLGTSLSQSFQCVDHTDECKYIDAYLTPFSKTTAKPTIPTSHPTLIPSKRPTSSPTYHPTYPTLHPTNRPSRNPSIYPSVYPSLYPTHNPSLFPTTFHPLSPTENPTLHTHAPSASPTTSIPTSHPSVTPTLHPTQSPNTMHPTHTPLQPTPIPTVPPTTPYPTNKPSIPFTPWKPLEPTATPTSTHPTQQIYYVVGDLTNAPTKYHNVYNRQRLDTSHVLGMVMDNKLYASIGAGFMTCCLLSICVRCFCKKRVAKPAVRKRRRYHSPKPELIYVKSASAAVSRLSRGASNKDDFVPPTPNEAELVDIEGFNEADPALPGTMGIIGPDGSVHTSNGYIEDMDESMDLVELGNGSRHSRDKRWAPTDFEISQIGGIKCSIYDDKDVEFLNDMPLRQ